MKVLRITLHRVCAMAAGIAAVFILMVVPTSAASRSAPDPDDSIFPLIVDFHVSSIDFLNEEYAEPVIFGAYCLSGDANALLRTHVVPPDVRPYGVFEPVTLTLDILNSVYSGIQARAVISEETAPEAEPFSGDSDGFMPEMNIVLAAVLVHVPEDTDSEETRTPDEHEDSSEPVAAEDEPEEGLENDAQIPYVAETAVSYIWPTQGEVTSRFGYRSASVGSTNHMGIDIGGDYGQSIYAAGAGEVIVSGWSDSYGYVVQIMHENGYVTLYCHCSKLLVSVGDAVLQGQEIARMGATGIASGTHLHFEILIDGVNVDPLPYLPSF